MERLPRGRHGLSPEFVAENQCERLIAGLTEVLHEVGYQQTTVSMIGRRAAVSKSDFYKHFDSKDDCFIAAYDAAIERVHGEARAACTQEADWAQGVCRALAAVLALLAREPACASLLLVEGLRGGRHLQERFQRGLASFVSDLSESAPPSPARTEVPGETAQAIVGGVASLIGRHVVDGEAERLEEFLPEIAAFALAPYLGTDEARRVVSAA